MIREFLRWLFPDKDKAIRELLSQHVNIMNKHGVDSNEEKEFLEIHKNNKELISLCNTANWLKKALMKK